MNDGSATGRASCHPEAPSAAPLGNVVEHRLRLIWVASLVFTDQLQRKPSVRLCRFQPFPVVRSEPAAVSAAQHSSLREPGAALARGRGFDARCPCSWAWSVAAVEAQ